MHAAQFNTRTLTGLMAGMAVSAASYYGYWFSRSRA
ncbi:hypothetical protein Y017_02215 [Alcanivorax sp. 97CO-5]|jgi:hypothetical protein|nr:hypothetical protein Y017_02215 [Alcanivorax sp. 97CO-5]